MARKVGRRKAAKVLDLHRGKLSRRKGVVGTGCGRASRRGMQCTERKMALRVYVAKKVPAAELDKRQMIPKEIDGVPTDIIEIEVGLAKRVTGKDLQGYKFEPMQGGIPIGRVGTHGVGGRGTLGAIVVDKEKNYSLLTAQHVIADGSCSMNITDCPVAQPDGDYASDYRIGYVFGDADWYRDASMDAAIALLYQDEIDARGIAGKIVGRGKIKAGFGSTKVETVVYKVGSTTGLTTGKIDDEKFSYAIPCSGSSDSVPMKNQLLIKPYWKDTDFTREGDSGALVVDADNKPVALIHAWAKLTSGSYAGIATPVRSVLKKLGVSIYLE